MNNLNQLMKQAQQMQAKFMEAQSKMNDIEITGTSGGGMVSVVISGKMDIKKLVIDPKLVSPEETDILADLIVAAFNDAKTKLEAEMSAQMGGLLPAGMKMPF
ncbi:MAG: YbaB/EbfC family nucleoid-associated protein [Holosporaceae bacterium]|jgi:DNA-binding YbaB/EbfC family protein|nr:YbaB/EbfC family nucleoid-associated protein [Holosporaceae bacterium]